jgi:hypothetical protein
MTTGRKVKLVIVKDCFSNEGILRVISLWGKEIYIGCYARDICGLNLLVLIDCL